MDIDQGTFSFEKIMSKLKSNVWYQKVEGMEELIKFLVDLDNEALMNVHKRERLFPSLVDHTI